MYRIILHVFDIVNEKKSELVCKLFNNVSTTMNKIKYDISVEWYYWYVYQAKYCIN